MISVVAQTAHASLNIPSTYGVDPDNYRTRHALKDIINEPLSVEDKP